MKKNLIFIIFIFSLSIVYPQSNDFFIKLSQKELATFNDAITLMRIIYNEKEDKDIFIENILWAAGKKLFQVTIPISPDKINPVISRKEFAYWCCQVFNLRNEKVKSPITRYFAYQFLTASGIMMPGRGQDDSFSGLELLDTYAYLLYYIKYKGIKPIEGALDIKDDYEYLPEWRKIIYKELDDQRALEKKQFDEKWKAALEKMKPVKKLKKTGEELKEKYIDATSDVK
jgi:hypothetical protein